MTDYKDFFRRMATDRLNECDDSELALGAHSTLHKQLEKVRAYLPENEQGVTGLYGELEDAAGGLMTQYQVDGYLKGYADALKLKELFKEHGIDIKK